MTTTQIITEVLQDVRRTEELELLQQRVWERVQRTWWDRYGTGVLWLTAITLAMAIWWEVVS